MTDAAQEVAYLIDKIRKCKTELELQQLGDKLKADVKQNAAWCRAKPDYDEVREAYAHRLGQIRQQNTIAPLQPRIAPLSNPLSPTNQKRLYLVLGGMLFNEAFRTEHLDSLGDLEWDVQQMVDFLNGADNEFAKLIGGSADKLFGNVVDMLGARRKIRDLNRQILETRSGIG